MEDSTGNSAKKSAEHSAQKPPAGIERSAQKSSSDTKRSAQGSSSSTKCSAQEPPIKGLSSEEVSARVASGDVNVDAGVKTRSVKQIMRENICTLFNLVNVILALFVLITGSYKDMLFMLVIVCNTIIGIVQEIRSKKTTDRLSIIAGTKGKVLRDGIQIEIPLNELVRDDVIVLGRGDQIPADSVVLKGSCAVNESLLTGESKLIKKEAGSNLMSGSFVNSGKILARVIHVGAENYAAKISAEAKEHKEVNSEIMNTLNGIIKFVSCIIFPLGALLFAREFFLSGTEFNSTILSTVSALVGMIPEGLILLTSTVLAVAVVRLAKSKVLVQQLFCIETLARVDTLCLDKTGTITTGEMEVAWLCETDQGAEVAGDAGKREEQSESGTDTNDTDASGREEQGELHQALASLVAADEDPNETAQAILAYFNLSARNTPSEDEGSQTDASTANTTSPTSPSEDAGATPPSSSTANASTTPALLECVRSIPFSSDKKWSGAVLSNGKSYVMGAAQFIMDERYQTIQAQADELSAEARLLLVARVDGFDEDGNIIGGPEPLGFVGIRDQIRSTAKQTIEFFKEQGVHVIVISGDDPHTVSGIAEKVGVEGAENYVDATTLKTQGDIEGAIDKYSVFGRVKPEQKKAFVLALQKEGHTVAMTGDGVNDTLALKASDCSIAMASGSDAARNVAQLVLVNNDFASMPKVVAEGRRSINNLQRSASLFLVKTLLCIVCAILFIFVPWQYPFQPIQMTLISMFTIGLPSFVLALEPNHDRIKGRFLENVIVRSIPGALCSILCIICANAVGYGFDLSYAQVSTMCVLLVSWIGINLVARISIPFTPIRTVLLIVVIAGSAGGHFLFPGLFSLTAYTPEMIAIVTCTGVVFAVVFHILYKKLDTWHSARQAKLV